MKSKPLGSIVPLWFVFLIVVLACNFGVARPADQVPTPLPPASPGNAATAAVIYEAATVVSETPSPAIAHAMRPADLAVTGQLVYDVESVDTAPEKRAPYGDSYDINRLERPFLQDMTYVPNLDISTYMLGQDNDWVYVSIALVGNDPNDSLGIHYAVELDTDHDGFGDYLIWAQPPYPARWDTTPVRIFHDTNHNTGGLSAEKSDAPLTADGYDTQVFNGGSGDADPDLAWVQANAGAQGFVQFAFKRLWSGSVFMLGVMADAGQRDPGKLDYVDRLKSVDAGSPVRDSKYYPLKGLYSVDNVCREAYGFKPTGYEPQLCPQEQPQPTRKPKSTPVPGPTSTPQLCLPAGTLIDTPFGPVAVEQLPVGDPVWSASQTGSRIRATILEVSRVSVPPGHPLLHVLLADGRELWASPGHPTSDGRTFSTLKPGDVLDGALVSFAELVRSDQPATYDLLPSGDSGLYWANGILIGSTLKQP